MLIGLLLDMRLRIGKNAEAGLAPAAGKSMTAPLVPKRAIAAVPMLSFRPGAAKGGLFEDAMGKVRLTVRVDFGLGGALGPGKIRLLEMIGKTGSISEAGRALDMSYRRAWLLVDDMNRCFRDPVVATKPGGVRGGGATLTAFGLELIEKYRAIEARATAAAKPQLHALDAALRQRARRQKQPLKTSIKATPAR
jgi:molybdate transport system regulatory protein